MVKSSRRQAASWNPWLAGLSAAVPVALAIAALPAAAATAGPAATGRATAAAANLTERTARPDLVAAIGIERLVEGQFARALDHVVLAKTRRRRGVLLREGGH